MVPAGALAGAGDIATYAGGVGEEIASQLRQVLKYVAVSGTNIYISDSTLAVVRRIDTTTGRETVVAGSGYGFSGNGGPATAPMWSSTLSASMARWMRRSPAARCAPTLPLPRYVSPRPASVQGLFWRSNIGDSQ